MRLIVTRPEPECSRTARALIRLGHEAILSPMLDIAIDESAAIPSREYQAVLVTSANAVRALAARTDGAPARSIPFLAVGDQTALEAKRAGFVAARSAGGALADLVALVGATLSPFDGPLLYVAGESRSGDLGDALAARGFDVTTVVAYRAEPHARLAMVAETALSSDTADGVLFYSRRSAAAFADALRRAKLAPLNSRVRCFCMSEAIAMALDGVTGGAVEVAASPNQLALFALIESAAAPDTASGVT